jgi:hypothetical protein
MISFTIGFAVPDLLYIERSMIPLEFESFNQDVTPFRFVKAVIFDERYIAVACRPEAFEIDLDFTFL